MNAIIIDDEPLARMIVKEYLHDYPSIKIVEECGDGLEAVKAILKHRPELIFLDVQMPKINGFEMLELIDEKPNVIFTTAFDEYAIKAFEANAIDYLLKPFSKERFATAIKKILNHAGSQSKKISDLLSTEAAPQLSVERIVVKTAGRIKIIPYSSIDFLEAADDYVKIHTSEGSFLKNKTMSFFEASLPASHFVRIHRSFIVNVQLVTRIDPYEKENHLVILKTGAQLQVSKAGYHKLRQVLGI